MEFGELVQRISDSVSFPLLSAFLIGIMAAVSPCPLATNISAMAYISRNITDRRYVITSGLLYTLGRMVSYFIIGAVVIPLISDHFRKRTPYLLLAVVGSILGLVGITFATTYWLLLASAFIFGFFLLSAGPVGFQYGAEVTYPTPEGTSNGLLLLMGQISGILFIFGMDIFKSTETGAMTLPLVVLIGLMVVSLFFCTRLKEAQVFMSEDEPL